MRHQITSPKKNTYLIGNYATKANNPRLAKLNYEIQMEKKEVQRESIGSLAKRLIVQGFTTIKKTEVEGVFLCLQKNPK